MSLLRLRLADRPPSLADEADRALTLGGSRWAPPVNDTPTRLGTSHRTRPAGVQGVVCGAGKDAEASAWNGRQCGGRGRSCLEATAAAAAAIEVDATDEVDNVAVAVAVEASLPLPATRRSVCRAAVGSIAQFTASPEPARRGSPRGRLSDEDELAECARGAEALVPSGGVARCASSHPPPRPRPSSSGAGGSLPACMRARRRSPGLVPIVRGGGGGGGGGGRRAERRRLIGRMAIDGLMDGG
eukprot:scaffold4135_cov260-Prasinococcus_capsulatus_cf.AAC.1